MLLITVLLYTLIEVILSCTLVCYRFSWSKAEEDSVGCAQRRLWPFIRRSFHSPGPNYSWHANGYDRMKPYGLAIFAWMCGRFFPACNVAKSRYTNNDPGLVAYYYINNDPGLVAYYYTSCLSEVVVCPQVLRTDCGTENGAMAAIQMLLCRNTAGSHPYGTSVASQRIECFWSHLRRSRAGFLMTLFKDLMGNDQLDLNGILDVGCCCCAFMEYVHHKLD